MNYLAIVVCAVIAQALGAFWYSPAGFGNQWLKMMKFSKKEINAMKKKNMAPSYLTMFVSSIVMASVLSCFITEMGVSTFVEGAKTGLWMWLGFLATTQIGSVLWEGKPVKFYLINTGYYFVLLLVFGGVLASWA